VLDYITFRDELERAGQLEEVGESTLITLLQVIPTSIMIVQYAEIVARAAAMRALITAAGRIAALGYEDHTDVAATFAQAQELLRRAAPTMLPGQWRTLRDALEAFVEGIEPEEAGSIGVGISTGLLDLDRLLGGLHRSDLVVLAARPSLGKTSLALGISRHVAVVENYPVAIFSLEMSEGQLAQRFLSMETEIDGERLRNGRLSEADQLKLSDALAVLAQAPIYLDDAPFLSIMELRAKANTLHAEHPLGLVVVDYLQLLSGANSGPRENRVQVVSEISRQLKALARELDCPVLAVSQLSRSVESRRPHIPQLSDLRDSGGIEQDADVVAFIYREDVYDRESERKGIAEIHIAKHRNGPTGIVELLFMERSTTFHSLGIAPL
jgi:replicative DNA helicase